MHFGIFDHLDDSGLPLSRHFEERLQLIEAYDRAGFYGYHLAEHHNTPLGYAPSPGVFLAAVAHRGIQSARAAPVCCRHGVDELRKQSRWRGRR
jgi:hypothetical protein